MPNWQKTCFSFGVPILVLGDPAQLPPVKGLGFFNRRKPDFLLTFIHRQKLDSPIVDWSQQVREGKRLTIQERDGSFVKSKLDVDIEPFLNADQILVGRNDTRHRMNVRVRELRGLPHGQPQPGDKLVCLKNVASKCLFNGEIWFVTELLETTREIIQMKIRSETGQRSDVTVSVPRELFEQAKPDLPAKRLNGLEQFTFAYALTVHKAQGSEWPSVVLYEVNQRNSLAARQNGFILASPALRRASAFMFEEQLFQASRPRTSNSSATFILTLPRLRLASLLPSAQSLMLSERLGR